MKALRQHTVAAHSDSAGLIEVRRVRYKMIQDDTTTSNTECEMMLQET